MRAQLTYFNKFLLIKGEPKNIKRTFVHFNFHSLDTLKNDTEIPVCSLIVNSSGLKCVGCFLPPGGGQNNQMTNRLVWV